ncbi:NADPH-dependent F420 reductase [Streptomyces albidus (ex Kaewkla and Franco 2022)]|uniref:NADPH-dependent F420 reductase n=1 Tax=Streptomyces albidus (ex Kaewkla and Franco 2022) TaxID=722709 RepID=UPI0015EF379A|nr:NAD(P)-binding domain-containing protein [Streptomyces albidus (ex Kaewkla and Franco 2022)]
MRIGLLGTGHVARSLATKWATAGHGVVLGSRRPEEHAGSSLAVTSLRDAAARGDVVVSALPGTVTVQALCALRPGTLDGKVLLDVGIGFTDDGALHPSEGSIGEEIQRALPRVRVVKSLCTMTAEIMSRPELLAEQTHLFLSGDDTDAKNTVGGLLADLGWPRSAQLDLGGITTAHVQEQYAKLFIALAGAKDADGRQVVESHRVNIKVVT